ncbi:VanZ family protein [Aquimarina rhabdastrellae]
MHRILLIVALLYTGVLTTLSLIKLMIPVNAQIQHTDKIGHLLAYFLFTVIWFAYALFRSVDKTYMYKLKIIAVIAFIYGTLMEACQMALTTNRQGDLYDVIANTTGIVFAVILLLLLKKSIKSLKKRILSINI